jgi:NAD-dependent deacetylase
MFVAHGQVAAWLQSSRFAVALTGAGISTDSGIPDFRSPSGVWATSRPVYFDEFLNSSAARHEYWRQKAISHQDFSTARPNAGHAMLAKWQRNGRLQRAITQNIDGLHGLAGSELVLELHGTARFVACLRCNARYEAGHMVERFLHEDGPPDCPACGGLLKHATISFGQPLSEDVLSEAIDLSERADLFLAVGSSLVVQPAASLPQIARQHGARLVIINRDSTPLDQFADAVIQAGISETLTELDRELELLKVSTTN